MAHIDFQNDLPGIRGPMAFRPETTKPLNELAEILLRDDNNTLTRGEREQDRQVYIERAKWRAEEGYVDFDLYK